MDVFLSWSTERSQKLAKIFNEWITNVLPTVKTYISTEQIGPGDRWSDSIGKGLETNFMGIFFMVEENVDSPWLNFEAGAISKNIEGSKVIPLLHDMKPEQINGPIAQFQAKLINQEPDIFSIVKQINTGINDERKINNEILKKLFDKWYPDFVEEYTKFCNDNPGPIETEDKKSSNLLDSEDQIGEILNIVRSLRRSEAKKNNSSERKPFRIGLNIEKALREDIQDYLNICELEKIMTFRYNVDFKYILGEETLDKYSSVPYAILNKILSEEVEKHIVNNIILDDLWKK